MNPEQRHNPQENPEGARKQEDEILKHMEMIAKTADPESNDPLGIRHLLEKNKKREPDLDLLLAKVKEWVVWKLNKLFPDDRAKEIDEVRIDWNNIGKSIRDYYIKITAKSLHVPEKEYSDMEKETLIGNKFIPLSIRTWCDRQKLFNKNFNRDVDSFREIFKAKTPEYAEEKRGNLTRQSFIQRIHQEGGSNLISEMIINSKNEEANYAEAELAVIDPATRRILDLNQALPNGYYFIPAAMKYQAPTAKEIQGEVEKPASTAKDLKSYKGTQEDKTYKFARVTSFNQEGEIIDKYIKYSDVTKTGGMLTLFHEISHAWQEVYYKEFGKYPFIEYVADVREKLQVYLYAWMNHDGDEDFLEYLSAKLAALGVSIKKEGEENTKDSFAIEVRVLKEPTGRDQPEVVIQDVMVDMEGEKFRELLEDYARQERDAWANAIRVIRMLRRQGFDIEPGLKTLDDFKSYIRSRLDTYQQGLETEHGVKPSGGTRKFVRKPKLSAGR